MDSRASHGAVWVARHIQNFTGATDLEPHWGYASRVRPCTSGQGTCEYLDDVYGSHDRGMLYVGIIWSTVGALLFIWAIVRQVTKGSSARHRGYQRIAGANAAAAATATTTTTTDNVEAQRQGTAAGRSMSLPAWISSVSRRYLLARNPLPSVFGNASRLQLLILTVIVGYLTIWTFLGMAYRTWITPVKSAPGKYNTRTSLGPWSDRVGVLAFALLPFSILLSSRESLLSLLTGIPYQHFNFLHRWLGHIILVQSLLHTIGWCIIEFRLYQPQPSVGREFVKETYIVWGIVAMSLLLILWLLSFSFAIKRTGYEFFRKAHYVLAMVFIGACYGHWKELECFLIPALAVWFLDRAIRLVRTFLLHYHPVHLDANTGSTAFSLSSAKATARVFPGSIPGEGDIVRLDLDLPNPAASWKVGQHFFLTFPECSLWQSHPFTSSSLPDDAGLNKHCYIFRAKGGETKKVAELAKDKIGRLGQLDRKGKKIVDERISVILSGAYGEDILEAAAASAACGNAEEYDEEDILCVAGGTGITYVLPVLMHHVALLQQDGGEKPTRTLKLIWVIRHQDDLAWLAEEMATLYNSGLVTIRIYVTRDGNDCHCASTAGGGAAAAAAAAAAISQAADEKSAVTEQEETEKEDSLSVGASVSSKSSSPAAAGGAGQGTVTVATSLSVLKGCSRSARPNLFKSVPEFVAESTHRRVRVYGSGPPGMLNDLSSAVAGCNPGALQAWRSKDAPPQVRLVCDDRLE